MVASGTISGMAWMDHLACNLPCMHLRLMVGAATWRGRRAGGMPMSGLTCFHSTLQQMVQLLGSRRYRNRVSLSVDSVAGWVPSQVCMGCQKLARALGVSWSRCRQGANAAGKLLIHGRCCAVEQLVQIVVGKSDTIYAFNSVGLPFEWVEGKGWRITSPPASGQVSLLACGSDGEPWAIDAEGQAYRWDEDFDWVKVGDMSISTIGVGNKNRVYVVAGLRHYVWR